MKAIYKVLVGLALVTVLPASITSCREDAPSVTQTAQVTVTNEFSKVVEAINNGALKNEQAIQELTKALTKMNTSQGEKLQAIIDVLKDVNSTLDAKLATLTAAIASPGTNLATKLEAIATAINNHVIAQDKLVEKITQSIDKLGGTLSSKMGEINQAIQDASKSSDEKFNLLLGVINSSTMTLGEKLQTIQTALASNKEILDKLDKAMAELLPTVKDNNERLKALEGLSAKVDEILKEVRAGREDAAKATKEILAKLDELIALLGGVTPPPPTPPATEIEEAVDLGLPSGTE